MKNSIKSLFALFVALSIVISCVCASVAALPESDDYEPGSATVEESESTTEEPSTEEPSTEEPSTEEKPEEDDELSTPESEDDVVGIIYLCSRWSSITTTGHLWVYIHNTSDSPITVGLLEVAPGEGVSLATFGFTRSDGFGIYYNMETYRNDKYCDESCISLSDNLTRGELEKITSKLLISNQWNPIINCVFFACSIWNIAGDRYIMPCTYPPVTRLFIKMAGGEEVCQMNYQPPENTFKQRGFGKNSYLDSLSQKSLDA
ncbi:MAG: hypothetical protein IIW48_06760 [Clostridia bacterium]|nr:hypothetical protein [Clostridia bacterium]